MGGKNQQPVDYSQRTNLFYVPTNNLADIHLLRSIGSATLPYPWLRQTPSIDGLWAGAPPATTAMSSTDKPAVCVDRHYLRHDALMINGRLILASFGRHSLPDEEKRLPCLSRER